MTAIVLAVALLLAGPSILDAFNGTGSTDTAMLHLVLALVVSALAGQVLRVVVRGYQAQAAEAELAADSTAEAGETDGFGSRRRGDH